MHMERRHKRELILEGTSRVEEQRGSQADGANGRDKKAVAGERGKPGPCRMVRFGVRRRNGVQAPRAPSQGD